MLQELEPMIMQLVALLVTIFTAIVTREVYRWTGIKLETNEREKAVANAQLEEKHQKVLHTAVETAAKTTDTFEDAYAYLRASVPDALESLSPNNDVLKKLVEKFKVAQPTKRAAKK